MLTLFQTLDADDDEARGNLARAVVKSVGRSLVGDAEAPPRAHYSAEERSFYGLVLAYGGDLVALPRGISRYRLPKRISTRAATATRPQRPAADLESPSEAAAPAIPSGASADGRLPPSIRPRRARGRRRRGRRRGGPGGRLAATPRPRRAPAACPRPARSSQVLKLVTRALGGPNHETVKRWRSSAARLWPGCIAEAIEYNVGLAVDTLVKYGLRDALYILGEDGTSCLKRIDVELVRVDDEWRIRCYGLACGPFDLRQGDAIEKLHQLAKEHGLATTFYVLSLIPLVKGASAAAPCETLSPSSPLCRWDLLE